MERVELKKYYCPGALGRIIELHGYYYNREWGVEEGFEGLVADELMEFHHRYDPDKDLMLLAVEDGRVIGSIIVDGSEPQEVPDDGVRLRWFIVDTCAHGRGIGKRLFQEAMDFCREKGFGAVYIWTVADLTASRNIYESFGFTVIHSEEDNRYSRPLTSLLMKLEL